MRKSLFIIASLSIPGLAHASDRVRVTGSFEVENEDLGLEAKGKVSFSLPSARSSPISVSWGARPYTPGYAIPPRWACYTDLEFPVGEGVWDVSFETKSGRVNATSRSDVNASFTFESPTDLTVDARNPPPVCHPHEHSNMHSVLRINFEREQKGISPSWASVGSELALGGLKTIVSSRHRRNALSYIGSTISLPAAVQFSKESGYILQSSGIRQAFGIPDGESRQLVADGIWVIAREASARQRSLYTDVEVVLEEQ